MNKEEKQKLIDSVPRWRHSIDCGDEIITPGTLAQKAIKRKLKKIKIPPLKGKSVLDIGAWDGFYSFKAEEMGADKVTALEYFSWLTDGNQKQLNSITHTMEPETFPEGSLDGKKGFDTVHLIKKSKVHSLVGDFTKINLNDLGEFDISLFLGVLYHLREPFTALRRLSSVTRELAIIETHAIYIPEQEDKALFQFYPGRELNNDPTNWWSPNLKGLKSACIAAGFKKISCTSKYPPNLQEHESIKELGYYRLAVHAYK